MCWKLENNLFSVFVKQGIQVVPNRGLSTFAKPLRRISRVVFLIQLVSITQLRVVRNQDQMGEGKVITINSKEDWTAVHQKAGDKAVRMSTALIPTLHYAAVDKILTAGHCRLFRHLVWALPHDFSLL